MKVDLTLRRVPSSDDISHIENLLREIHPNVTQTSQEGLSISFAAPTTDIDAFGELFRSWLNAPESIMHGFHMVEDI